MNPKLDQIERKMKNAQNSMSQMNSMVRSSALNQKHLQFITSKEQTEILRTRLQTGLWEAAVEVAAEGIVKVDLEQATWAHARRILRGMLRRRPRIAPCVRVLR